MRKANSQFDAIDCEYAECGLCFGRGANEVGFTATYQSVPSLVGQTQTSQPLKIDHVARISPRNTARRGYSLIFSPKGRKMGIILPS